jgi:hypothetical protein
MTVLRKFLYLDETSLDDYVSALEDGLRQKREISSAATSDKSGELNVRVARGGVGAGSSSGESTEYADTPPAKFNRLLELAEANEEDMAWLEIQDLSQLDGVGFGALVHLECEAYIPDMVRMFASGDLADAIGLMQNLGGFADALGLDMTGMPTGHEIEGIEAATKMIKSDLVFVGEDDASAWKIAGKLSKAHLRDPDVEGFVKVVGKVSKQWPAQQWKPLMALPGASLVPRKERRDMERKVPDNPDDDSYLEGPAVMIDVLAVYR